VTVNTFLMLQKISISNNFGSFVTLKTGERMLFTIFVDQINAALVDFIQQHL